MKKIEVKGGAYDISAMCGGDIEQDPVHRFNEAVDYESPSNVAWRRMCDYFKGLNAGQESLEVINRVLGRDNLENLIKIQEPMARDLMEERLAEAHGISGHKNELANDKKKKSSLSL